MSEVVRISLKLSPESLRALQALPAVFEEAMLQRLERISDHVEINVKREIRIKQIYNTGALYSSIKGWVGRVGARLVASVGSSLEYAAYVEKGTVPHFVPFTIAPSLYLQARRAWGWTVPKGQGLYTTASDGQLYLVPPGGGRPRSGVRVTGEKQPYLHPGWVQSLTYIRQQLLAGLADAVRRASEGSR